MGANVQTGPHTSSGSTIDYQPERTFDDEAMRHSLDGEVSVLHCHHYATLFTQLACDAECMNGPRHLAEATTESIQSVLETYYAKHGVKEIRDRIRIAEQYWSFVGMGQASFRFEKDHGVATMPHSHIDEGWIKKWGRRKDPVNFVGQGYVAAVWAAVFGRKASECEVEERASIVCGDDHSEFTIDW